MPDYLDASLTESSLSECCCIITVSLFTCYDGFFSLLHAALLFFFFNFVLTQILSLTYTVLHALQVVMYKKVIYKLAKLLSHGPNHMCHIIIYCVN